MTWAFMTDPITGNIGLYNEPVNSGAFNDPNSARNAPLNSPISNLKDLIWHIQLDNMEVFMEQDVTVSHPAVPIGTDALGSGDNTSNGSTQFDFSYTPIDYDVLTHGLGYQPIIFVADGTKILSPGQIIQRGPSTTVATRYVSFYVDNTKVWIRETASRGGVILPALTKTYKIIVIRQQRPAEGNVPPILKDYNPVSGLLKLGDGRFASDRRYIQVVPGSSPFGLALGRTMDFNNGTPRQVDVDGVITETTPAEFGIRFYIRGITYAPDAPVPGNYGGTFTGDTTLRIGAP